MVVVTLGTYARDPIVRATTALTVVVALPIVLPILPPDFRGPYVETATTLPFLVLAMATFLQRARESGGRERRFWNAMTAGTVCWMAQQMVLIATYTSPWTVASALLQDLLYVGLYCFVVLAFDTRPHFRPQPDDRGALPALRRTGTVVFVFGMLFYLVFAPAILDASSYWAGMPSFCLYLVLDAYLVIRAARAFVSVSETDPRWRAVYGWMLATCAGWLVLDSAEALMWAEILPWIGPGTAWDLPWLIPLITLVMTGRVQALVERDPVTMASEAAPRRSGHVVTGGPLILLALLVPFLHFTFYGLGLFGEGTRRTHEITAFGLLVVLGGLVFSYQRALERRARKLEMERRRAWARVEHQAYHDSLTGLPNRRLLDDRAQQAISSADRRREGLALFFIDLDGFKEVNDSSGHAVGDELLRRIGERLTATIRSSDTLARVGGDEFVIMANDVEGRDAAVTLAEKTRECFLEPFRISECDYRLSASVGVALYPDDACDLEGLLRFADAAMYEAKQGSRGELSTAREDSSADRSQRPPRWNMEEESAG